MTRRLSSWNLLPIRVPSSLLHELGIFEILRALWSNFMQMKGMLSNTPPLWKLRSNLLTKNWNCWLKNEALSIRVESLERELLDKEKLLLDRKAELSQLGGNLDWLVKDGIVRIVDKVIELPNFLQGVGQINNMCFDAGEELGRELLRKEIVVRTFDPNVSSSTSSHTGEIVDAIDSFFTCDYASLMNLGSLDVSGLLRLCVDDDNGGASPSSNIKVTGLDGNVGT
ncbi:unnamed protein product [Lactuca virosa]|nr:unnamed protein product [Lactuca virosa]